MNATYGDLRSARAQLTWLTHARPDVCTIANMLAQFTTNSFDIKHVKEYNSTVKYLKKTARQGLFMQQIDKESLHLRIYADASFANNSDYTSQIGYIVFLADKTGKCNRFRYASYKSRRVYQPGWTDGGFERSTS